MAEQSQQEVLGSIRVDLPEESGADSSARPQGPQNQNEAAFDAAKKLFEQLRTSFDSFKRGPMSGIADLGASAGKVSESLKGGLSKGLAAIGLSTETAAAALGAIAPVAIAAGAAVGALAFIFNKAGDSVAKIGDRIGRLAPLSPTIAGLSAEAQRAEVERGLKEADLSKGSLGFGASALQRLYDTWAPIGTLLENIGTIVGASLAQIASSLLQPIATLASWLNAWVADVSDILGPILSRVMDFAKGLGESLWNMVFRPVFALVGGIYEAVSAAFRIVSSLVEALGKIATLDFGGAWDTLSGMGAKLSEDGPTFDRLMNKVGGIGDDVRRIREAASERRDGNRILEDELRQLGGVFG